MQKNSVARITQENNFKTAKALGQNFLTDEDAERLIVSSLMAGPEDTVVEIGPGVGHLTSLIADEARYVKAVEIDKRLIPILKASLALKGNVEIINQDILQTDIASLAENPVVLGNLPYYITTPILMKFIEEDVSMKRAVFMVQKEVADKLTEKPSGKSYGLLAVIMQQFFHVEQLLTVPPESFLPPPKVYSEVIRLTPNEEGRRALADKDEFISFVKAAFAKRRKTLGNSLIGYKSMDKQQVQELLQGCGIDPMRRCETLSPDEFAELSNKIKEIRK